jgi:hypothetical protein
MYVNLTQHPINLNDGRTFPASGQIARVSSQYSQIDGDFCTVNFGAITGLPDPVPGTFLIVSGMVASATDRQDVVSPATGHPDCIRNNKGQIISVPCFIRK